MPTTGRFAFRYPNAGYSAAIWQWIQELAEDVDARIAVSLTTAARDALPPAEVVAGRVIWNSTTGRPQFYTGAAWVDLPTGGPFLPTAGGTVTGDVTLNANRVVRPMLKAYRLERLDLGTGAGAVVFDLDLANEFVRVVNGSSSFTISNPAPSGGPVSAIDLLLHHSGGPHAITWPASFRWPGGTPPVFTAGSWNLIGGLSFDGGTTFQVGASLAHG